VFAPIPGECGNGMCEESYNENKCDCPSDCGACLGPVSPNMEMTCVGSLCLEGVPPAKIKPITSSAEISAGGDKIRVTTTYNQPFNIIKDLVNLKFSIVSESKYNNNRKIASLILEGNTPDRRTITIAEKTINRNIWSNQEIDIDMIVDFPTTLKEDNLKDLVLKITYEYDYTTGSTKTPKSVIVKNSYRGIIFNWVKPTTQYPCPETCDDNNMGTQDVCDASTKFFCEHRPVPGACGNFICDGAEDKCTCPGDCGPCTGDAGAYLTYGCVQNKCTAQLKSGISVTPSSIFDDRKIGAFQMQNNYNYNDPLNTAADTFSLDLNLYDKQEDVSNIKITAVRLFESTNEIASTTQLLALPAVGQSGTLEIVIPPQPEPEMEKSITLKVWYEYEKGGETQKGSFSKSLGKITLLTPG